MGERSFGGLFHFVGRASELEALRAAVAEAREGRGGLSMVCGEPGIGKSRLAEELAREVGAAGAATLWGPCWEGGGAPPYWPWIQVLRALLRDAPAAFAREARAPHLVQLLPELRERQPGLGDPPSLSPEQARFQLLDAAAGALCEAAEERPLLVVLDDLHAADRSSLLLLDFLARQVRSSKVAVLGTFRDAEARRSDNGALLFRLAREARTIPLARLTAGEVESFLTGAVGRELEPDLVEGLRARTEGNPLFLVELARLLVTYGELDAEEARELPLPQGVRAAIRERLANISPRARESLARASVVGRELDAGLLAELLERDPEEVREALEEAKGSAIVFEAGHGKHRFSHSLIREVLYGDLDEERRRGLHRRLAERLRSRYAGGREAPWSEIAHHFFAAGDEGRGPAVEAARRAGEAASSQLAFEDAAAHYRTALAALEEDGERDSARVFEVLLGLAHAQMRGGAFEEGRAICLRAAQLARSLGAPELLARAALELGSVLVFARVDPDLVALLCEARDRLPEGDSALRARVLARLAAAMQPALDSDEPMALARTAIEMARRAGDRATLLDALRAGGSSFADLAPPAERIALDREHVALAAELSDPAEALRGHARLIIDCFELRDRAGAEANIEALRRAASRLDHPSFLWRARAADAARALWEGRFTEAEELIEAAGALGAEGGDPNAAHTALFQRVRLLRLLGRKRELTSACAELRQLFQGTRVAGTLMEIYASAHALHADPEGGSPAPDGPEAGAVDEVLAVGDRPVLESLSEIAWATGDQGIAEKVRPRLEPQADTFLTSGVIGMTWDGPVARPLGLLCATVGDTDGARRQHERGIEACRALGGRPLVAWMSVELAEVLSAVAESAGRERARELLSEAAPIAEELGMTGVRERVDAVRRALGDASPPAARAAGRGRRFALRADGEFWTVEHEAATFRLKDTKGLRFLARLVESPGQEVHVLDLAHPQVSEGAIDLGDAGEVLDDQARLAYRRRIEELRRRIEEAESWNDLGRAESCREELAAIETELAGALGLGGRSRRAGSAAERARINVQRRIRDAIRRIEEHDEPLARHLTRSVRTGTFCAYDPE